MSAAPAARRALSPPPIAPSRLSRELREGTSADLARRRWVVGLNLAGTAMAQLVTLYQTGIVRHLPDPPAPGPGPGGRLLDADRVDASDYAYSRGRGPDGPLMLLSLAATTYLAAAGGRDRARDAPLLPLAAAAKAAYDTALAAKLAREEWAENRALCAYCQAATLFSTAALALAAPEAARAAFRLIDGRRAD